MADILVGLNRFEPFLMVDLFADPLFPLSKDPAVNAYPV